MRLTKQTGHAIRILIDCARAGGQLVKVAEIAGRLGITQQNAFKIVHRLSRAGLVEAVRGRSGGVRLAAPPDTMRLGTVVRVMELTHVTVDGETAFGQARPAAINVILDEALEAFIDVLDQHTLADMARGARVALVTPTAPVAAGAIKGKAFGPKQKSRTAAKSTAPDQRSQ